jgi:hypothetical protein
MPRRVTPLLALLLATACTSFVKLEPEEVVSLSLHLGGGGDSVCVNDPDANVVAEVVYRDGKRLESWNGHGSRSGKLRLHDLAIESRGVAVDDVGRLRYRRDALTGFDRPSTITARLPARELRAELTVKPRFDCGGVADYHGKGGATGSSSGRGDDGESGPALEIGLARLDTERSGRILVVRVTPRGAAPDYYLVDTRGPIEPFAISAGGGNGGAGGDGTDGWSGADGMDGVDGSSGGRCVDGSDGTDGMDGQPGGDGDDGGDGGDGGAGGAITVEYAPGDADLVDRLRYLVHGGTAGAAGRGGSGGAGGAGGRGGRGGTAGESQDERGRFCQTSSGDSGHDGRSGTSGSSGASGRTGLPGAAGSITARPTAAEDLWKNELAAGVPIVLPAGDVPVVAPRL